MKQFLILGLTVYAFTVIAAPSKTEETSPDTGRASAIDAGKSRSKDMKKIESSRGLKETETRRGTSPAIDVRNSPTGQDGAPDM